MRFASGTLLVFMAGTASVAGSRQESAPPSVGPTASPSPSASPSPAPRYKLLPYGFEVAKERSSVPLLRFEDKAEVRSIEMNQAIARFFENGDMRRGATPGGAPTLGEMASYRHQVSPSVDFLLLASLAIKEIRKQVEKRQGMEPAEPSPGASPSPTPAPSPTPGPSRN